MIISPTTGEALIDCGTMQIKRASERAHFRLSPNLLDFFGPLWRGTFFLAVAAVAHALIQNYDTTCSLIEILIGEVISSQPLHDFMANRDRLIKPLVQLAPPCSPASIPDDSIVWMDDLLKLIDTASNPNLHPIPCIPWF
jgi:hypothetical protein